MFNTPLTRYRPTRTPDGSGGWIDSYDAGVAFFGALAIHDNKEALWIDRLEDVRIDDVISAVDENESAEAYYRVIQDHRPGRARRRKLTLERLEHPIFPASDFVLYDGDRILIGSGYWIAS